MGRDTKLLCSLLAVLLLYNLEASMWWQVSGSLPSTWFWQTHARRLQPCWPGSIAVSAICGDIRGSKPDTAA
ncbi:hypothetical protein V8C35DRAFT_308127 [Trichoderma chlorosporum]